VGNTAVSGYTSFRIVVDVKQNEKGKMMKAEKCVFPFRCFSLSTHTLTFPVLL
jgi:hypothetical protein